MKSPWKFLVQLASRGRSDVAEGHSTDNVTKAGDSQGQQGGEPSAKAPKATKPNHSELPRELIADADAALAELDNVATTAPVVDTETVQRVDDEANHSVISVRASAPKSKTRVTSSDKKQSQAPLSAKIKATGTSVGANIIADEVGPDQTFSNELSLSNEMVNLDENIRQLRLQLAEKLRLQNTQLKVMLERFERS